MSTLGQGNKKDTSSHVLDLEQLPCGVHNQ